MELSDRINSRPSYLVRHLGFIEFPVEQVDALLQLAHLGGGEYTSHGWKLSTTIYGNLARSTRGGADLLDQAMVGRVPAELHIRAMSARLQPSL